MHRCRLMNSSRFGDSIRVSNMKEIDIAYTAGIVDGEGCIVIRKTPGKHDQMNPSHVLVVDIVNTSAALIDWLKMRFEGHVYETRQKAPWRTKWSWRLTGSSAAAFLQQVHPYLVIKSEQARLGLEFQAKQFSSRGRARPATEEELAERDEYKSRISLLNRPLGA